ncbi:MAG: TlpA family protein disulfide reductase [Acidimicrobiales bacterium]
MWEGTNAFTEARTFCELWGVKGTVLVDERGTLVEKLGIRGVPTNVFVDIDGTVQAIGASTPRELETAVRELLGPDTPLDEAIPSGNWHWETDPDRIGEQLGLRGDRPGEAARRKGCGRETGSAEG